MAASLAPNPELAGLDTSSHLFSGPAHPVQQQSINATRALTDIPSIVSDVAEGMVRQDEGAAPDEDAMSVDGQNNGAEEDQDDDDEDEEEEEDPASGSEFSAGSADIARQEKEDRAFDAERLDHIAGNATSGRDHHNQQRGFREDSQTSQPRGRGDITMDAELDPDLYGLRRSVSKMLLFRFVFTQTDNLVHLKNRGAIARASVQKYLEDSDDEVVRPPRRGGKGKGRAKDDESDEDAMPYRSTPYSRRRSGQSESASAEDDQAESDADDDFYADKKGKGRSKSKRQTINKGKKKLRRAGNDSEDFDSDLYAAYGSRNAPRAKRDPVNYNEAEAYDSMLSDEITPDEDDDDDEDEDSNRDGEAHKKSIAAQGDAVDGVFDHKRADDACALYA